MKVVGISNQGLAYSKIDMYDSFYSFEYMVCLIIVLDVLLDKIFPPTCLIRNFTIINLNNAAYAIEKYEDKQKFRQIINVDFSKFLF